MITTKDYLHKLFQIYKEATKNISGDELKYAFKSKDAEACFLDFERTIIFSNTLAACLETLDLKLDTKLLEAGSGTGIIAVLIAKKFPDIKITCIEINEITAKKSIEFVKALNLKNQIRILNMDLCSGKLQFATTFDIIFSETLSGGLFYEPQIQIVQNIKKYLNPNGILIPKRIDLFIHLESPFELETLTEKVKYAEIDFLSFEGDIIETNIEMLIKKTGTPNIIVVSSELYLTENIRVESSPKYRNFLNKAILNIPFNQQRELKEGERIKIYLTYKAGSNTKDTKILLN